MHRSANNLAARLLLLATNLRAQLAPHFAEDTASSGCFDPAVPASGHCAAVSVIALNHWEAALADAGFRVSYVSARVNGVSHWFVRVAAPDGAAFDVDLTGDQFPGRPPVQVACAGTLYEGTNMRSARDVNEETMLRAAALATRARLAMPLAALVA